MFMMQFFAFATLNGAVELSFFIPAGLRIYSNSQKSNKELKQPVCYGFQMGKIKI